MTVISGNNYNNYESKNKLGTKYTKYTKYTTNIAIRKNAGGGGYTVWRRGWDRRKLN